MRFIAKTVGILRTSPEPLLFMYVVGLLLESPLLNQYIYHEVGEKYNFPYNYHNQNKCKHMMLNKTRQTAQDEVQSMASSFNIGFMVCNYVPSTLVCLLLGSWSDKVGRKPILALSVIGGFLEITIILVKIYFKLPLWVILVAGFVNGLGGFFTGLLIGSMAYIADTTPKEQRSTRLGIMEGIVFFGGMLTSFPSGYILDKLGFLKSFWVAWACMAGSLLFTILILKESNPQRTRDTTVAKSPGFFSLVTNVYHALTQARPNKWKVYLTLPSVILYTPLEQGLGPLFTLHLLDRPLCFNSKKLGFFLGSRFCITGIGAAICLKFLLRFIPENKLVFLGFISHAASVILFAFSDSDWSVYLSAFLAFFAGIVIPIYRSIISKNTAADEQGAIFSLSASMEMLSTLICGVILTGFYKFSREKLNFPAGTFLFNVGLSLIPIVLSIIYAVKCGRETVVYESLNSGDEAPIQETLDRDKDAVA